ncbi:MAG TPA: LuxR C-terminal-related transcriptional regulator [Pseudonocardiaceae bacterium]|jgi:predicted ATPase/DNA-binding CsgD family transcriptional regulator|nr:LuxR C-terminal-related transcriptional regulator [Pseudonocardiaceae bacterium]
MTARRALAGYLPADATAFVGRRRLLDAAGHALTEYRLVTLLGPGGVGKTRAAIHLARTRGRATPGGVWLVDLATVDDPELVARAVAATLGIHDQSQRPALDAVTAHVRDLGPVLIVLDNCEHLIPAIATLADTLLRHTPDARLLATSRQPLGVPGEHRVRVRPMTMPSRAELLDGATLDAISHYDAVRLFLDRVTDAGIRLTDADTTTVGELVSALEGVPLAIELAAARTTTISLADILARVNDPLRLLASPDHIAHPDHHRTLHSTLQWSHQRCTPAEQHLWARLAVFVGGFDLAAAEAVCADDTLPATEILTVLDGLVRQSLVTVLRPPGRTYGGPPVRYRMLETVRAYGQARLAAQRQDSETRRRHRDYYRQLSEQAAVDWFSPRELNWMDRIRAELPNIRTALGSAVTTHDTGTGLTTVVNLTRCRAWFFAGTLSEARYWLRILYNQQPDTPMALIVLTSGAWIAACQADHRSALSIIADCLRVARDTHATDTAHQDLSAAMIAFAKGAYLLFCQGNMPAAATQFTRARDGLLRAELPGDAHMARLCRTAATAAGTDPHTAFDATHDCTRDAETAGAQWATSWAQWAHGIAHLAHGDPHQAQTLLRAGLRTQHTAGDHWGPPWSLVGLGWTAAALGEHDRAALLIGAAHRHYQRIGLDTTAMALLGQLGATAEHTARHALGNHAYRNSYTAGFELDYDTAVTTALADNAAVPEESAKDRAPRPATIANSDSPDNTQLTDRERDVARLLGADPGLTNKDMAARLYVSVRTIEAHLNHIMRKLGVTSRAQIAVWATTHTSHSR